MPGRMLTNCKEGKFSVKDKDGELGEGKWEKDG